MSSTERPPQMTPMLRQYHEIKRRYPGTILFFRLGDFYEMFFEDAIIGARELEITLTARNKERGDPVPMCGIPYHAATGYIAKFVRKGYRVAICEQIADSSTNSKLFRRDVVRVITPGTAIETQLLESKRNNYLAAFCGAGEGMGLAFLDLSTGEFLATEFRGETAWQHIQEQLAVFSPSEVLYPNSLGPLLRAARETRTESGSTTSSKDGDSAFVIGEDAAYTPLDDWLFGFEHAEGLLREQFRVKSLDGFGLKDRVFAVCAAGAAIHYVNATQRAHASHLGAITFLEPGDYLSLDTTTVANLELVSASGGRPAHSLLGV
ncbi:MAG: DNA mismatch repair protein MutS, partial [Acidobacteriota bacterium]